MSDSIGVTILREGAAVPQRQTSGSFGYDIATVQREEIGPRDTRVVPSGLQLADDLPTGIDCLAMLILPRSSLPLKYGLILPNSPGLIDADFSEEIGIIVHNLTDEVVVLEPGTRIAQALFVRVALPALRETTPNSARGRGGFGSTGAQ
ncbi:MAG: dUTP diphosphatase [Gemmatimonadales bacterium]